MFPYCFIAYLFIENGEDASSLRRASIFERRRTKCTRVRKTERNAKMRSIYAVLGIGDIIADIKGHAYALAKLFTSVHFLFPNTIDDREATIYPVSTTNFRKF